MPGAPYRKPFDVLAERPSSGSWLPIVDTFRTFCLAPEPEILSIFNELVRFTLLSMISGDPS
jgi:hypothetical protein